MSALLNTAAVFASAGAYVGWCAVRAHLALRKQRRLESTKPTVDWRW